MPLALALQLASAMCRAQSLALRLALALWRSRSLALRLALAVLRLRRHGQERRRLRRRRTMAEELLADAVADGVDLVDHVREQRVDLARIEALAGGETEPGVERAE